MVPAALGVVKVVERTEAFDGGVELLCEDADELRRGVLGDVDADGLWSDGCERGSGSGGDARG